MRIVLVAAVAVLTWAVLASAQPPSTAQPEGLRDNTPAVHALVNARLVLAPGRTIDKGTVVIRDGRIVSVGASDDTSPPADARVWDLKGRTVYPGLIDAYGELSDGSGGPQQGRGARGGAAQPGESQGQELLRPASATGGAAYWNPRVTPQLRADLQYRPDAETNKKLRSQGIVARLVAPSRQVIKGTSAAVATGDADGTRSVLRGVVALHLQLAPVGAPFSERGYPASPMGAVALVRQAMYDAQWYARARAAWEADPSLPRPERNDALEALQPAVAGSLPVVVDTTDEKYALRADRLAKEFKLNVVIHGSGQEYRRSDEIAATGRAVIVPVNFGRPPNVASPDSALAYSLEELMDWDLQPENPARLEKAGVKIALTSQGLRDRAEYLKSVRKAVARGLPAEAALRAMTVTPADVLGLSRTHGTIEVGKSAGLVVTDGDLFDEKTQVLETWVDGTRYEVTALPKEDARGTWAVKLGDDAKPVSIKLTGEPTKLKGTFATGTATTKPAAGLFSWLGVGGGGGRTGSRRGGSDLANLTYASSQLSFTFKGDVLHLDGVVQVSATVSGDKWIGTGVRPDGTTFAVTATRSAPYSKEDEKKDAEARSRRRSRAGDAGEAKEDEGSEAAEESERPQVAREGTTRQGARPTTRPAEPAAPAPQPEAVASVPARPEPPPGERERSTTAVTTPPPPAGAAAATQPAPAALARQAEKASTKPSLFPVNYPLGAFGRAHEPEQPDAVLFKGATVWTCGPRGKLARASVLVERGKISAVYADGEPVKELPAGAVVVDCAGMHLSPGIIDCHSHIATDGGINESSRSITCQVRIGDFIDPDDVNIYRQLAGGVTAANVLHGSANTIGGQNQVIKMRWGAPAEAMKFAEAPPGVKFALGENVKRSNFEGSTRAGAGGPPPRYPLSRMGVEQLVRDAFSAARDYRREWDQYKASGGKGIPPRVDLELEALGEIVEGRRMIHCHSYRQDEILALIRTCEQFGVKVATFQHVLEGYKVADALARHGAGGSTFSDWWAYKYEAWDAIPYNGSIMREAGVNVSFNSDDAELARRLNTEAAKSEKYGGVPEEEALKFVTLNPAKQLRIDQYVGSIEPGKHADLALWSGSPLSGLSRCEQTWVDGRRYFDRKEDQEMRRTNAQMRAALVQKILGGGERLSDEEEREPRPRDAWKHDHEENRACDCGVIWRR